MTRKTQVSKNCKTHVKQGDRIVVITGDYKGISGQILRVCRKTSRVVVEGVDQIKRHTRQQANGNAGQTVMRDRYIHISNVKKIS